MMSTQKREVLEGYLNVDVEDAEEHSFVIPEVVEQQQQGESGSGVHQKEVGRELWWVRMVVGIDLEKQQRRRAC